MTVSGTVRWWDDEAGWGVVDSAETPGGCWTHFSHVRVGGYRRLLAGQQVDLDWEAPGQDGYAYRAVSVTPAGAEPVGHPRSSQLSGAYGSRLTLTFDPPRQDPVPDD